MREITFDGYVAPSILEIDGAKDIAVELHSFSKTYNLPGIRLGFFAGNREIIKILSDVKSNIHNMVSGTFLGRNLR